jgi:hypothetical protein
LVKVTEDVQEEIVEIEEEVVVVEEMQETGGG